MKKTVKIFALSLISLVAMSFTINNIKDGNYVVNNAESKVIWNGKKVTGEHMGTVAIKSGNLEIVNGNLTGGSFQIDMTTITSTDLEGEYLQKLNGHLKSDDFFGVENFPTATFIITKVEANGANGKYKVTGDITIKETTKSISFDTQLVTEGDKVIAVSDITIDRSEFDVRYGSGSFFDNLGDKTIYDDFTLQVKLVTAG